MSTPRFAAGAIDLSGLKARAQQPAPGAPPARGAGGGGSYVLESSEQTFETDAIRASMTYPVVVELYSPRVSTGQQLSEALADIAAENAGKFLLVRLNVDTSPSIVQALQLQAVPTVIALISGQLAPLFQGVLPRDQVAAAITQVLQAAVTNGLVGRAEPVGGTPEPTDEADADGPDPRFAAADASLDAGDFDTAVAEFDKLLAANPADAEAVAGKAQAGLLARATKLNAAAVAAAVAEPDASVADQLAAADLDMATGRVEEAFARLIAQIKARAGDERNQVRVRLLELFETIGNTDPRVLKGRRELMAALF